MSYNALSGEAQRGEGRTHTGDSCVANTGLVSESFGIVGLPPDSLTLGTQVTSGPEGSITPVGDESNPATSHLACVQRSLQSKAFLATLPSSSWQLGGQVQTQFIIPPGKNDIAGVSQRKLIHFALLCRYDGVLSSLF